jgi:DNA integrity scanning protein DisA with diadenylate cyclase activity
LAPGWQQKYRGENLLRSTPFVHRCVRETLEGLRDGLTHFSGESRAALIFTLHKSDPLQIFDPQGLLRGHEPRLKTLFFDSEGWCQAVPEDLHPSFYSYIEPQPALRLDGLITNGGSSVSVHYQMWFTEHHPNICSVGPILCWLEHAVLRFSHDIANDDLLYTGISGSFLREYGTHAVRDCIIDKTNLQLGPDVHIRIYPILDALLGISKTSEEGARPHGALAFVEPRLHKQIRFLAKFAADEQPLLVNFKHVRKLLQAVEYADRTLISDGRHILGIAEKRIDTFHIMAEFFGKIGFLKVGGETICSFQDGSYSSNTYRARLFEIEEALLDFDLEPEVRSDMFQIVAELVHTAEDQMYGCTFVIDLADQPTATSGQALVPPVNLRQPEKLRLAAGLARVDGALHIRADLHLYAFACLLDGHRVENEDRARGARYNSALRYTAQHPETIVVVVSSDRPVSIFQQGREVIDNGNHSAVTSCSLIPLPLQEWLARGD